MKIAVLSQDREALQQIRETLAANDSSSEIELFEGALGRILPLVEQEHPDLLIVDLGDEVTPDLRTLEPIALRYPAMTIILIYPNPTHEFLVQAMRIGVREVLPSRLPEQGLKQAVGRIQQRISWATTPRTQGKIFALMACKGGSGATFLATNLAYALASGKDSRVLLIDLNLHFGEALLYISDVAPPSTVADVSRQIQRLDGAFLESSTVQVLHNFGVLAAPESPEKVVEVKPESVERLLKVAVNYYDYVVLDISRNLDAVSIKALDRADMILPVLQITLPFIRDAKRLIDVFHSLGYPNSKINLIVNRYEKGGEISLDDAGRTLGVSVFKTVPNSYASVAASINHGIPILRLAPRDPVAKALQEMAQALVSGNKQASGWLRALLSRTT